MVVAVSCARKASASAINPRFVLPSRVLAMVYRAMPARSSLCSISVTGSPRRRQAAAIPAPMVPRPITPIWDSGRATVSAENVATEYDISREDQDRFALSSQTQAERAIDSGAYEAELCPVEIPQRRGASVRVKADEHPRAKALKALAKLKAPFRDGGTVTAGNSSGVNDGAAALLLASDDAISQQGLTPLARFDAATSAGIAPRVMGIGPVPATQKFCDRIGPRPQIFDLIEPNEAFAAQAIAVCRALEIDPMAGHVNPRRGAIALGHPLGMTGARLAGTAALALSRADAKRALVSLCVGVGHGVSMALSRT